MAPCCTSNSWLLTSQSRRAFKGEALVSHFQDHRHDQRTARGLLHDVAFQVRADFLLHHAPIGFLLLVGTLECFGNHLAGLFEELGALFGDGETAADDLRQVFDAAGMAVDGDDGQHDAVFGAYLSRQHFEDVENSCPMTALPTDVARGSASTKRAFETVFQAMVSVLERSTAGDGGPPREQAQAIAALCVGGMIVARAM